MRLVCFVLIFIFLITPVLADTGYVICRPDDYINVRAKASTRSTSLGRFTTGDTIELDGKHKHGFLHGSVSLEASDGWIHSGYIVYDEPVYSGEYYIIVSNGRVACRRYINGPRRCWLKNGQRVKAYYVTEEWTLTNLGFIKTQYLEYDGEE